MVVGLAPSQPESEREGGPHTTGYSSELTNSSELTRKIAAKRTCKLRCELELLRSSDDVPNQSLLVLPPALQSAPSPTPSSMPPSPRPSTPISPCTPCPLTITPTSEYLAPTPSHAGSSPPRPNLLLPESPPPMSPLPEILSSVSSSSRSSSLERPSQESPAPESPAPLPPLSPPVPAPSVQQQSNLAVFNIP